MGCRRSVILLVEQNKTLRSTLRRHLERHLPVDLIEAANASQALDLMGRSSPDVVLLDLSLPNESGVGLLGELRSVHSPARVIAMTEYLDGSYSDTVVDLGVWACVTKDTLGSNLEPLVREALEVGAGLLHPPMAPMQLPAPRRLRQTFFEARDRFARVTRWLDLNGPWAGKPRTRLLYVANVVAVMFVIAIQNHVIGS